MKQDTKWLVAMGVALLGIFLTRKASAVKELATEFGNSIASFFKPEEFACKDGTPVPASLTPNLQELVEQLDAIRREVGPLIVVSGYRTKSYNAKIDGADKSQHLTARAADISSPNMSASQLADTIESLIAQGKVRDGGLGRYAAWVHYDVGTPRRWNA